jgi:ketosteroid isomerase-like protein
MTPLETAQHYLELFNAGQHAEMGALFAPDGIWRRPPPAPEVRGGAAIHAGYGSAEHALQVTGITMSAKRYLVDGSTVAAEFIFHTPRADMEVLDVFDIDEDGRIACMTAYARPPS